MRNLAISMLLAAAFVLGGCALVKGPGAERRDKAFAESIETYRKLIRWGYFEEAAQYLKSKDGEPLPIPNLDAYRKYKVTGYDVGEQVANDDGSEARVMAQIEFYEVDSHVAGSVRDVQHWWYDEEARRWYLNSPLPTFSVGPQVRVINR